MVYAVGLGFRGEPPEALADKTWLYSPDSDVPWYRATMLSNYDAQNAAEGCWSVLCEISTSKHRPENVTDLAQRTIDSIVRLGARAADLVDVWQRTVPMGYPVPTLGRDAVIRHIDDMLLQQDRPSTRMNSSHVATTYAVCCLKKNELSPAALTADDD